MGQPTRQFAFVIYATTESCAPVHNLPYLHNFHIFVDRWNVFMVWKYLKDIWRNPITLSGRCALLLGTMICSIRLNLFWSLNGWWQKWQICPAGVHKDASLSYLHLLSIAQGNDSSCVALRFNFDIWHAVPYYASINHSGIISCCQEAGIIT